MTDILLATYNGERFLREQLDSLFMQTYGDFKIIAHDDGSTDGTLEILKEYQEKFHGKLNIIEDNISYKSSCKNFLNLIKYSDAEYVMFCDQDDVWLEEKVRVSVEAISELENSDGQKLPAMVSSGAMLADENMNEIVCDETKLATYCPRTDFASLLVQNYFMGCTMIFNRELARLVKTQADYIEMHDWWVALLAAGTGKIGIVDKKLMKYRQHGKNVVGATDIKSAGYIASKLNAAKLKEACGNLLRQAQSFKDCYYDVITDENKKLLNMFCSLRKQNKIKRINTQLKYGFKKSTTARLIGQLMFM